MYILSIILTRRNTKKTIKTGIFILIYSFSTFIIVPFIAPKFGRETVNDSELIQAHTFFTKVLNRNYVKPELNIILEQTSIALNKKHQGIKLVYLDANFPFIDKFPLLPHMSHNDGKKIDLSLIYKDQKGKTTNLKPSISGYGIYENSKENEYNQTKRCKEKGYWQYDFTKYITFGKINKEIHLSELTTKFLITNLVNNNRIEKIFIEPHLKKRMHLTHNKMRFHGCRAVRHDDHIHIQLR